MLRKKEMIKIILDEEIKAWNILEKEKELLGEDSFSFKDARSRALALWDLAKKLDLIKL